MASEIKVDTISEKTSAGGVTIDGLLIKDGNISGDVALAGTTPTFTIGDAGAEDAALVFDGNAQDYYIALDDSADDLLIGLGSTVGTTPAIAIDENLKVNLPVTTASTSASTGSLTTGGGMGVGADLYVGDDTYLITDSAVLGFGADKDTTLTHTDGTGLTLNSTNKLCFNDASQFIQGSSATVLSIGATDEIDLTATAVDLNGTLNVSGVATFQATPVFPDGSLALDDLDIDGGTDIGADLVDADEIIVDDGGGGTNRRCDMSRVKTYIGEVGYVKLVSDTDLDGDSSWVVGSSYITSTYDAYKVIMSGVKLDNDNTAINIETSPNNGSQYNTDYDSTQFIIGHTDSDDSSNVENQDGASTVGLTNAVFGSGNDASTDEFFNLDMNVYKRGSDLDGFIISWTASYGSNGGVLVHEIGTMTPRSGTTLNAFKIYPASGNFAEGKATVYGMVQ